MISQRVLIAAIAPLALAGKVQWAGINLFGLANDVSIFGSAYTSFINLECEPTFDSYPFLDDLSHYEAWKQEGFNLFRTAIAWQHAQTELGGALNETNMQHVDKLVDAITDDGGKAILDIHNYARWYCAIIGQPENSFQNPNTSVTNAHFSDLWVKLASRYRANPNVIFQLMNEPHDIDIMKWRETSQEAILGIRTVAQNNTILVSGTQFARLVDWKAFSMAGVGPGLVSDPANKLMFDFHQYFDGLSGAYGVCEPWSGYYEQFQQVTDILRAAGAQGMLTEFGGGPFPHDVWHGWTAWGSFNKGSGLYLSLDRNSTFYSTTSVIKQFAPRKI
ncbi:hypothetical protein PWT90_03114 [Aphanocladium album]|nr:hypothetical protein PWT90_03114 [Aphanocladium album]